MSISDLMNDEPVEEVAAPTPEPEPEAIQAAFEADTTPAAADVTDAVLNAILNKMVPVKDKTRRKNFKMLIYSDPGCGKTVFTGTAPDNMIIDVEDGLISLDNHPDMVADTVHAIPYNSFMGLDAIIQKLLEAPPELDHIKTLTIDSLNELHKRSLAEITERDYWASPSTRNRFVPETEHYTESSEQIRRLVSKMRDLDRNLILTAHAKTVEPKGKPSKTYPDFSEKLANTIAGIVDVVGYMYLKEVEGKTVRVLRLHSNGGIVAKTRVGGFPEEIVNPTWPSMYEVFLAN